LKTLGLYKETKQSFILASLSDLSWSPLSNSSKGIDMPCANETVIFDGRYNMQEHANKIERME